MIAAAVHSAARPTPRLLPQPLHIPWYLHPDHATSERWFAAAEFAAVTEATVRAASRPDLRGCLDRAAKLTEEATRLGKDGDEARVRKAMTFHLYAAELRREAGAWSQSAENYGALTRHHLYCGKLRAAVAYLRKLLFVTEGASTPEERLDACLLAATVYLAVHQVTPARDATVEATGIAARIGDQKGLEEAERRFAQIGALANQRPTGKKVVRCACGEMKPYVECCGVADGLPAEFQARAGAHGPQSGHASLWGLPGQAGIDLLMERPGRAGECLNWVGVRIEDGRQSLVTLPNWSGRAMRAARVASRLSLSDPDATEHPWSTVLQVACGVEAFINAVEHFIARSGPERWAHIKFPDCTAEADPERQGSIVKRLAGIGAALFGPEWPKSMRLDDLGSLMALRNTLVHFNGDHEERIVPIALKEPAMLRRFKGCFEMRDPPRPWIDRVLTPGLATWAVDLGDGLIAAFRNSWHEQQEQFANEMSDWDHEEAERLAEAWY